MAAEKPKSVTIRSYDVGFGDCFLLSFEYPSRHRHVLIDFGSMEGPDDKRESGHAIKGSYMVRIAKQIEQDCGGKLDAVVATHRHEDHISGFARGKGKGPGEIIRGLKPRVVIQPWTEDPRTPTNATGPTQALHKRSLRLMQQLAGELVQAGAQLKGARFAALRAELQAIGMDNIKNADAVKNLQDMARNHFVHYGRASGLAGILSGVKVTVLGPPTVDQTNTVLEQRRRDPDEFWHLNTTFWRRFAMTARRHAPGSKPLFQRGAIGRLPRSAGWFRYRMRAERAESLLSIVRMLDEVMNNTSIILLFEVGGRKLLFPGDAQYENWMHALGKQSVLDKLAAVDLYKVGHHGSLNATPKTLWRGFTRKGAASKPGRLKTLMSTKEGVHGKPANDSEVPRGKLVNALQAESALTATHRFAPDELSRSVKLDLS